MCRKKEKQDYRTELEKKGEEKHFTMSDGTIVRVLDFNLAENPDEYTFLLVPGYVTVFQSWQKITELLTPKHRVIYFESREKFTATVSRKLERKMTFSQLGHDIKEVVEQMGLADQKYIGICSSTGGTILFEALAKKWLSPTGLVAIGPSMVYYIKTFVTFLSRFIPNFIIRLLFRPFVRWYLKRAYVDDKAEPEQMVKYMRAFDEAIIKRALVLLRRMRKYDGWDLPSKIDTPSVLIGASADVMHATKNCKRVDSLMPNSYYVDLGTNKAAHEQPLIDEIYKFIQKIEEKKI
ncbi:MAG: alpha/beta fold hydrolase [Candidatus Heimdallarchaeota archaeon]